MLHVVYFVYGKYFQAFFKRNKILDCIYKRVHYTKMFYVVADQKKSSKDLWREWKTAESLQQAKHTRVHKYVKWQWNSQKRVKGKTINIGRISTLNEIENAGAKSNV